MNLAEEDVHGLEPQALAARLRKLGAGLAGRNLSRESWLVVARALRRYVPGNQLLMRLRAATTRQDALRILRVAQTFERDAHRAHGTANARGTGARRRRKPAPVETPAESEPALPEEPHRHHDDCTCFRTDTFPFDFRVWQAWDLLTRGGTAATVAEQLPPALRQALDLAVRGGLSGVCPSPASTLRSARTPNAVDYLGAVWNVGTDASAGGRAKGLPAVTQLDLDALIALCPVAGVSGENRYELEFRDHRLFVVALLLAPLWLRSPSSWSRPATGDPVRSLVNHLFVEFPIPAMMYEAWNLAHESAGDSKAISCFVLLGRGMSLKSAGARLGWRFPGRFVYWLGQAPAQADFRAGLLWAEVMRLSGSEVEYRRLRRWRVFSEIDPTGPPHPNIADPRAAAAAHEPDLQFLRDTIRWLTNHREALNEASADEILCWASARHRAGRRPRGQRFHWDGRTPRSASAAAAAWLARDEEGSEPLTWASRGWDWVAGPGDEWTAHELVSSNELFVEGFELEHCVASYATDCHSGRSAIFALSRRGERKLTIEIDPESRMIRQAKGFANRDPTAEENDILQAWLREVVWSAPGAPRA